MIYTTAWSNSNQKEGNGDIHKVLRFQWYKYV